MCWKMFLNPSLMLDFSFLLLLLDFYSFDFPYVFMILLSDNFSLLCLRFYLHLMHYIGSDGLTWPPVCLLYELMYFLQFMGILADCRLNTNMSICFSLFPSSFGAYVPFFFRIYFLFQQ